MQDDETKNQLGGRYKFDQLSAFNTTSSSLYGFHCHKVNNPLGELIGAKWWPYNSNHNYTLDIRGFQDSNASVINKSNKFDFFNEENSVDIINSFVDFNFPTRPNPDNDSGIWNRTDLIKHRYDSVVKFSSNFNKLQELDKVHKIVDELRNFEPSWLKVEDRKLIQNSILTIENYEFKNLGEVILYRDKVKTRGNKDFIFKGSASNQSNWNKFQALLVNDGILTSSDQEPLAHLALLYDRLTGFFATNQISMDINGNNYKVWDGSNFLKNFAFYENKGQDTNQLTLNLSNLKVSPIVADIKYGVVSFDTIVPIDLDKQKIYLNYKNNFKEVNEIIISTDEEIQKSILISALDDDVTNFTWVDDSDLPFIYPQAIKPIFDELNQKFGTLLKDLELFKYDLRSNDTKYRNLDETLKQFGFIPEDFLNINVNPLSRHGLSDEIVNPNGLLNNDDGIFYMIGTIANWNSADGVALNGYEGDYSIKAKQEWLDKLNYNGTNAVELENANANDTNGYILLKLRANKTSYTENMKDIKEILVNYDSIYKINLTIEIKEGHYSDEEITNVNLTINDSFVKDPTNADIFYDAYDPLIGERPKKEVWSKIESNPLAIFTYRDIVFNEKNIMYANEVANETALLDTGITTIRSNLEKKFKNKIIINQANVDGFWYMVILIPIAAVLVLISLILIILKKKKHRRLAAYAKD